MHRRQFLTFAGGAVVGPLAAAAQQGRTPLLGFLHLGTQEANRGLMDYFRKGLRETGFVDGKNLTIEYRWAESRNDRLQTLAIDLVARGADVLAVAGGPAAIHAAKNASSSIPIIFSIGSDPIENNIVRSLSKPEANATGISYMAAELVGMQLELLRMINPDLTKVGHLVNPVNLDVEGRNVPTLGPRLGILIQNVEADRKASIIRCFESLATEGIGALVVRNDPLFLTSRFLIAELAIKHQIVVAYGVHEMVQAGGLLSYATDRNEVYREHGIYVGRVLNGAKPSDLPVLQPTRFKLFLNSKTATAMGLSFPPQLLARADEVIE